MKISQIMRNIQNGPIGFYLLLTEVESGIDPELCEKLSRYFESGFCNFAIEIHEIS